ncbi:MAG TPA: CrcB family protein [Candidatus Limnocylindrales bacterium]|nr:CrcB family protein [Candidatus Limnocylindrales bacterium]
MTLLLIAAGGAAGAVTRHVVDGAVLARFGGVFPLGTLLVNLSGAFLVGLLAGLMLDRGLLPADLRAPLFVGFLGAYTTFSTLMLESWGLIEKGLPVFGALNLVGSTALGMVVVLAGLWLGRTIGA